MKHWFVIIYFLLFYSCSKKSGNRLPSLLVNDISQNRLDTNNSFHFIFSLDKPASKQITVQYTTKDGTAVSNKDYLPASGSVTINAGESQAQVDVTVIGDSLRQPFQQFYLELSNAVNSTLISDEAIATIKNDGTYLPTDNSGYTTSLSYPGYTLVWSDEFNSTSINTNTWNFETGGTGWGNNELENYTSRTENAFQSSGNLVIEARAESYGGNNYTSARMTTQNKQQFQFGRIDIRAKLPVGQGIWPALWMLGTNIPQVGWPTCGETDIMELIGKTPKEIYGTLHYANSGGSNSSLGSNYSIGSGDFSQQFHVFSVIWKQDSISLLVDDNVYFSGNSQNISSGSWPFNSASFFIFNVAVGGDWPGSPDGTTVFPEHLFVDYVRVFQ
jgi:beta-glucanase (GH16 family)